MWGAPARAPPGLLGGFSGPFTDSDRRGFAQRNPSLPLPLYAGVSQKLRPSAVTPRKVEDPRSREKLCGKPGPGGSLLARWPLCCVARQSHSQTLGFWALQGQVDVSGCRPHSLIRKYIPQLFFFFFWCQALGQRYGPDQQQALAFLESRMCQGRQPRHPRSINRITLGVAKPWICESLGEMQLNAGFEGGFLNC